MWLRYLLPTSKPFIKSRILAYGFNAGMIDRSASVGIRQWAIDFLNQLDLLRSSDEVDLPIALSADIDS